eukprot:g4678.t1
MGVFNQPRFHAEKVTRTKLRQMHRVIKYTHMDFHNITFMHNTFFDQNILIVGTGDSATETSNEVQKYARSITLTSRSIRKTLIDKKSGISTEPWPCYNEDNDAENIQIDFETISKADGGLVLSCPSYDMHYNEGYVHMANSGDVADHNNWNTQNVVSPIGIHRDVSLLNDKFDRVIFCTGFRGEKYGRRITSLYHSSLQDSIHNSTSTTDAQINHGTYEIKGSNGLYVTGAAFHTLNHTLFGNVDIPMIRSITTTLLQAINLKLVDMDNKAMDIWRSRKISMPDLVSGEYILERLGSYNATHMAILPGKVCDVITLRGGICEASHTSDEIIGDEGSDIIDMDEDPRIYFESESFARYYHSVNLQFAPKIARLSRSIDFITICFKDETSTSHSDNDNSSFFIHPHFLEAYKSLGGFAYDMSNITTQVMNVGKFQSKNFHLQEGFNVGPGIKYDGRKAVISYFDMSLHGESMPTQYGWRLDQLGGNAQLVPVYSYHMAAKKAFFLCSATPMKGDKVSKDILNGADYNVKLQTEAGLD